MKEYYITFGQQHVHDINGTIFDKNCVGLIKAKDYLESRSIAFDLFGPEFFTVYEKQDFKESSMKFFPRGVINVN